ncbi:MAG: TetR/AcrR family transcriptional regulator [Actinomycetota bacterium]
MRTRLLDAAEKLYAAEGSTALTNRKISAAALTTTQSIYTYYGSREALIDDMYRRAIEGVQSLLDSTVVVAPPVEQRTPHSIVDTFQTLARAYRQYCLAHPARFRLLRAAGADPEAPEEAGQLRERLVATLIGFGRSGGHWQDPIYENRVRLTVSAVHGFIMAEIDSFVRPEHGGDRLFDELVYRCLVPYEQLEAVEFDWSNTSVPPAG